MLQNQPQRLPIDTVEFRAGGHWVMSFLSLLSPRDQYSHTAWLQGHHSQGAPGGTDDIEDKVKATLLGTGLCIRNHLTG